MVVEHSGLRSLHLHLHMHADLHRCSGFGDKGFPEAIMASSMSIWKFGVNIVHTSLIYWVRRVIEDTR